MAPPPPPPPQNPLVAIVGATGTGKSQLAVELAKRYNGEVVNGDAMQLYEGLPIITNTIPAAERDGVPHHLLGCIGPREQTWVVGSFVRHALRVIDDIRARGRLPILVGGTHYYTQSLLFHDQLAESDQALQQREFVADTSEKWPILKEPTEVLLDELKKVDPVMADRWHPHDRRKIQRSLEIYLQTGRKASSIYAQRRSEAAVRRAPMRFPTLLFWVHAEQQTLHARLDARVDQMVARGLLEEVEALHALATESHTGGGPVDESKGIWVSIGYKEFRDYVTARHNPAHDPHALQQMYAEALEKTKTATRQYSKRQVRWIRIKLLNALADADASHRLYLLDGSRAAEFGPTVVQPALEVAGKFLRAEAMPAPASIAPAAAELLPPPRDHAAPTPPAWVKHHCPPCDITCVTPIQWQQHLASNRHRKRAATPPHPSSEPDPSSARKKRRATDERHP